jgi:transposase
MRKRILTGIERRRHWSGERRLAIVSEIGVNGARFADIARRHDLNRAQIYQWRRKLVRRGPIEVERSVFLPVTAEPPVANETPVEGAHPVTVGLAKGRTLSVTTAMPPAVLQLLVRAVEGA